MRICFFMGHRDAPDTLLPLLVDEVERHITEYGVTSYFVGHYGRFDVLAAKAVMAAKKRHPEVTLTLLLPYHPYDRPISVPKGFDNTYYPPGMERVPKPLAISRANRHMMEHSDFLIAYVWHPAGSSWERLEAALRRQARGLLHVINLAPRKGLPANEAACCGKT